MTATVHSFLNGFGRQRFELCKQLQTQSTDMVFISETHLKPHER